MDDERPKLRFDVPVDQCELWVEANVRKSEVLLNIEELVGSVRKRGILVPLLAKYDDSKKKYLVFSGQRRLEAAKLAPLKEVPCFIFKDIDLTTAKILSLSENLYREAMTEDDKSRAAVELFKKFKNMERVALALGVKEQTVRRYLKYDDIPEELRKFSKKEHGGLSSKEIEDIYFKFPDLDRAIAVAKKLGSFKKGTKQRRKYHESVRKSSSSDQVKDIVERAERLIRMQDFHILLPDTESKTIEKIAITRKMTSEELLVDIIEQWIEGYLSGKHR